MRIRSPLPSLEIHTTPASMEIRNHPVRLKIRSEPARMQVSRTRPQFRVNWEKMRRNTGARSRTYQQRYEQQVARQQLKESIANANSTLEMLSIAETAGLPSAQSLVGGANMTQAAKQNDLSQPTLSVVDAGMPEIEWENGNLEIGWVPHSLEMSWEGNFKPEITVTPHSVEIRLISGETIRVQENEARAIEMRGEGKKVDTNV